MTQFDSDIVTTGNPVWRLAIFGLAAFFFLAVMIAALGHQNLTARAELSKTDTEQRLESTLEKTAAALNANPDNIDLRLKRANLLLDLHDKEGAYASARSLALGVETAKHHFQLGRLLMRLGDDDLAVTHFQRVIAAQSDKSGDPFNASAITHLADAYIRAGQLRAAQTLLDQYPDTNERILLRARLAHQRGELQRAQNLVQTLIDHEPADPRYWALAGDIALDANDFERASIAANEMRGVDAFVLRADLVDVKIAIREGRFDDAIAVLAPLAARWPASPALRDAEGFFALNVGDARQSAERYNILIDQYAHDTMRTLRLIAAKHINGDDAQADLLMGGLHDTQNGSWLLNHLDTERLLHRHFMAVRAIENQSIENEASNPIEMAAFDRLVDTAPYREIGLVQRLRAHASMGNLDAARRDLLTLSAPGKVKISTLQTGNDILFGQFAHPFQGARDDHAIIEKLVRALKLRLVGEPEKAMAIVARLKVTPNDRLYALGALVRAEIALDVFDDKSAARLLEGLTQTHAVAASSLWAINLSARLDVRSGQDDLALARVRAAVEQSVPGSLDVMVRDQLQRADLNAAIAAVRKGELALQDPALFYRLVTDCLDRGGKCYGQGKERAALLNDLAQYGSLMVTANSTGGLNAKMYGDAAMIRLQEKRAPSQGPWIRYRAFYQAYGDTSSGQLLFADLVAKARRWQDANRMVRALEDQGAGGAGEKDEAMSVRAKILAEHLRARRSGRAMRLKALLARAPHHPLVLNSVAAAISDNRYSAATKKRYGRALGAAVSASASAPILGVRVSGAGVLGQPNLDMDNVLAAMISALGAKETRTIFAALDDENLSAFADTRTVTARERVKTALWRLDRETASKAHFAQAKRDFFGEFDHQQIETWAGLSNDRHAQAYCVALVQTGYRDQALRLARDASLPASFLDKLENETVDIQ